MRNRLLLILGIVAVCAVSVSAEKSYWITHSGELMFSSARDEIKPYEFKDNKEIRKVWLWGSITKVGEYAFAGCTSLEQVVIMESAGMGVELGEGCFSGCTSLRYVNIKNKSLKALPKAAFSWCESLAEIRIPKSLKDIGAHCFAYCSSLKEITLHDGIEHIGNNAFSRCSSLTEVRVPDSVTELESYAFSDCINLESATLPANSSLLGELIFSGCGNLRDLWEMSPIPPKFDCESFIFEPDEVALYRQCRLHVPPASEHLYVNAPGWCLFIFNSFGQ